ncbi:MAG: hypothetical protein PHF60_02585 [Candidatus ainarchaeum sp.]|nr:hypothetical protein [Candidatus ainarchaeum sp.]
MVSERLERKVRDSCRSGINVLMQSERTERVVRDVVGSGMSVLTQNEMRTRFTGTMPKSLMPLAEKLRKLDPVKDAGEYKETLGAYLRLTKRI